MKLEKKCILFARVSTYGQELDSQERELRQQAEYLGYARANIIYIAYKESGVKLSIEERLGIKELKERVQNEAQVDCVIIHEISRLTRRPKDLYEIRDWLIERSIQLVCIKPYFKLLDEATGKISESANLLLGLYASMIENEGYIRKERMHRGKMQAVQQGKFIGGTVRFGFCVDSDGHLLPDEENGTADIIRQMFSKYSEGVNISYIRQWMKNTYGVVKMNEYIFEMLKCEKYIQIVGKDLFDKVQQVRLSKTIVSKERRHSFGEKLLKCPFCGMGMKVWSQAYRCHAKNPKYKDTDKYCTGQLNIKKNLIDSILFDYACCCHNLLIIRGNDEQKKQIEKDLEDLPLQIAVCEKELSKINGKLEKLSDSYVAGLISKDKMLKQRDIVFADRARLENDVKKLQNTQRQLTKMMEENQDDLLWKKCVDEREFYQLGKVKIYELVHHYIERVDIEFSGKNKVVVVKPVEWIKNVVSRYEIINHGRLGCSVNKQVDNIWIDISDRFQFSVDWENI